MAEQKDSLWKLFFTFFRIGLFTIGGGLAMLPMLEREIVEKHKWASSEEIIDYYAVGQSTPGIIAINVATFIGYKCKGIIGGIVATLGMIAPSLVIIMVIASFFQKFAENIWMQKFFSGVRVVVIVLIVNAVIKMGKKVIYGWMGAIISLLSFLLVVLFSLSPIYVIIIMSIIGVFVNIFKYKG